MGTPPAGHIGLRRAGPEGSPIADKRTARRPMSSTPLRSRASAGSRGVAEARTGEVATSTRAMRGAGNAGESARVMSVGSVRALSGRALSGAHRRRRSAQPASPKPVMASRMQQPIPAPRVKRRLTGEGRSEADRAALGLAGFWPYRAAQCCPSVRTSDRCSYRSTAYSQASATCSDFYTRRPPCLDAHSQVRPCSRI